METINLRINYLAEKYFNGNNVKFSKAVESSEANIRNYRKLTPPKIEFIVKTCEVLNISLDWLLLGKGEIEQQKESKEYPINKMVMKVEEPFYSSELVAAQKKTIAILEETIEDLRSDKVFLKNVINDKLEKGEGIT